MKFIGNLLALLVVLAALAFGVLFSLQNRQPVALDLLVHSFQPHSLALWVLSAFALGGLAGVLASSLAMVKMRAGRAATRRQLQRANTDLDRLRTAGLTGSE
ncbi:MAG: lipopolysaccharide assembly protein LapA domain-containing protein [Parahaliea sp.]